MNLPPHRLFFLFVAVLLAWAGLHLAAGTWLFEDTGRSWAAVRGHLILEGGMLLVVGTMTVARFRRAGEGERIDWLAEEAGRLERGEEPRKGLSGDDSAASLSASLRRMALRLRAIDEHAIVAFTDRKGVITSVNDRFCAISGYSREELIGKTHRVINSGVHPKEFFQEMWNTISAGRVWRGEIENRSKDGAHYFVATTIVPCPGDDGIPEQYIALRTDVTEQKAASERLHVLTRELTAKNSDLEMLIHAASHDLRSPLVNVQGFASVVGDHSETIGNLLRAAADGQTPDRGTVEELASETAQAVRFICAGAEKMDALLKGLLVFSRLGRAAPALRKVDAATLVNNSLDAMRYQIESSGAEVNIGPLPHCLADPQLLDHVVSNLLDNAIKYRRPDLPPRIRISASSGPDRVEYRIEDNGIGIAPEHRGKIFELFHRLDPRHSNGHGLGLAIVRRAVDRMSGTITVEANPDNGTTFIVSLTAVPGADPSPLRS